MFQQEHTNIQAVYQNKLVNRYAVVLNNLPSLLKPLENVLLVYGTTDRESQTTWILSENSDTLGKKVDDFNKIPESIWNRIEREIVDLRSSEITSIPERFMKSIHAQRLREQQLEEFDFTSCRNDE